MFQPSACDFRRRRLVGCDLRNYADRAQESNETECFDLLLVFSSSNKQNKTIKHCYIKIVGSFIQEKKPDCNGRELITKSVSTSTMTIKRTCNPVQVQFVLQNIRSVSMNLDDFEVYNDSMSQKPEVVCLTETWLNPSYNNNCFSLNGYQTIKASNRKKDVDVLHSF